MTLRITPEACELCYDFMDALPPFCDWNLPPAHDVRFVVFEKPRLYGYYRWEDGKHTIAIGPKVGHTRTLVETMAHEMVHLAQAVHKTETKAEHNAAFFKMIEEVARWHGFDPCCL